MVAAPADQVEHALDVHVELGCDLLGLRLTAELTLQRATGGPDLVELLDDVHGQPDHPGLLRDAARDRLTHPPGGVRRELVALRVVELLDRTDEPGVALLHQVEHRHRRTPVLAGDRHDQSQVGLDEALRRALALVDEPLELFARRPLRCAPLGTSDPSGVEQVLGQQTGLDRLGKLYFGGGIEQGRAGDLVEIHPHAVAALDRAVAIEL
jgi:hypothetical protein